MITADRRTIVRVSAGLLLLGLLVWLWLQADGRTWLLARNTVYLVGGTCALALPAGTLLALLLVRTDVAGRRLSILLIGAMLFVPLYLQSAGWNAGFGQQGWFSVTVRTPADAPLLSGWRAAIWIHAMAAVPWVVLIVGAGLRLAEPDVEECALLDGSTRQVFTHVTLRRARPAVVVAALWIIVSAAGEMTVTNIYQVRTYSEELYTQLSLGNDPGEAGLSILPGIALTAAVVVAVLLMARAASPPDHLPPLSRPLVFRLGAWRYLAGLVSTGVVLAIAGVPLSNLCYKAGVQVQQVGMERLRIWSLSKFIRVIAASPGQFRYEIGWTLLIGTLAATLAVLLAAPLAWWARQSRLAVWIAIVATAAGLATPGPLIGLSIIGLLNRRESTVLVWLYDQTICAPVLAMMLRGLPLAVLICWYALHSVSKDVLDTASLDGASGLTRFLRIAAAQRIGALTAAWLVVLAVATGDLAASILVVPPGVDTVAIRIFGLVHYGVDDQLAGLSLTTAGGFVVIAAIAMSLFSRSRTLGRAD